MPEARRRYFNKRTVVPLVRTHEAPSPVAKGGIHDRVGVLLPSCAGSACQQRGCDCGAGARHARRARRGCTTAGLHVPLLKRSSCSVGASGRSHSREILCNQRSGPARSRAAPSGSRLGVQRRISVPPCAPPTAAAAARAARRAVCTRRGAEGRTHQAEKLSVSKLPPPDLPPVLHASAQLPVQCGGTPATF